MSDANVIYDDKFQRISFDEEQSLLRLTWLEQSQDMNYAQFQGALLVFAGFALDRKPHRALVETEQFGAADTVSDFEAMSDWRDTQIVPLYNQAGIKRFAFAHAPGSPTPPNDGAQLRGYDFPTRHFDSADKALAWLAE